MFNKSTLASLLLCSLATTQLVAGANLRSQNASNNRRNTKASECTIMASELLLIDPSSGAPDQIFECEMDPEDMGGISGLSLPLQATNAQKNALRAMLEKGDLISGKSKLVHGPNAAFDENGLLLPPGLDIAASVRKNPNNDRRNLAVVTGTKPILVVKVTDSVGKARSETPFEIGDNIFGYGTDQVNLKSQMAACSMNTLDIVPGSDPNGSQSATGVVEVTINVSLEGNSRSTIRNAVTTAVTNKIGESLPGRYQQVMYVLEGCYLDCGWAAYAYINSWNSVYQGNYYYMTGVQMHELGHNFNLAHSGGLDGATYTDHTGLMVRFICRNKLILSVIVYQILIFCCFYSSG